MATVELRLNSRKPGNYAFFCPVTKIHLTLTNPVGITNRVSAYILRAIKSKTLIDVNGVINLETGEVNANTSVKAEPKKEKEVKMVKQETTATQDQKEESLSQEAEAVVENVEPRKTRKSRKSE